MDRIMLIDSLIQRLDTRTEAIVVEEPFASGPERCVLIFDRSGSMAYDDYRPTRLLAAFDAGLEFVAAKIVASPSDLVSIVLFDDEAEVICEDVSLQDAVRTLKRLKVKNPIAGGTDINSGLLAAERLFQRERPNYRKRIVLLTDGHGGDPVRTGERLRRGGVLIDVIGVAGDPSDVAENELRKIASVVRDTSRYRFIGNRAELLQHFRTIATDLVRVR